MSDNPELKPCPFCGGTEIDTHGDDKVIGYHCLTCGAVGPNQYITYPEVREWNTRAEPKVNARSRSVSILKHSINIESGGYWQPSNDMLRRILSALEGQS